MKGKVSIITPSFNRSDLIDETAKSIFNQTYDNWEWVIVDDGSTDASWDIIEKYAKQDKRVKIKQRDRLPKGACTCRNIGVELGTGEFLIFLDTDDIIEPFCLENRVKAMQENPELDFAIFPSLMFETMPNDLQLWWNVDKPVSELKRQFYQDAICQGTGILITKTAFVKVGLWDEELTLWQDIDLFFRLYIQQYRYKKFFTLPPDLHNRVNPTSLSRANFLRYDKLVSREKVIKRTSNLLIMNQQETLLSELKYMLAEVASGYMREKKWKKASKLINWGAGCRVITISEFKLLNKLQLIYQFKLYKLNWFKNYMTKVSSIFTAPIQVTLGTLSTRK